jgi:hypothetical protein
MIIGRREILIGGVMIAALPSFPARGATSVLPVPVGNRLQFDIMRKGSKLGKHELSFSPAADGVTVHAAVELTYKILGVTLYHYTHRATEIWADNQVVALQAMTNDNGAQYSVTARRGPGGLAVQGSKAPRYIAPVDALPASHWNQRELEGPWINTQDGRLMRPKVTAGHVETIPAGGGRSLSARRFNLSGEVQLDLWYDDHLGWSGLSFIKGGALIRYERQV